MEIVEKLLEEPEQTAFVAYMGFTTATTAYAVRKNDFGAGSKTRIELEEYIDDTETGITSPIQTYKTHVYRKELEDRDESIESRYGLQ